MRLLQGAGAVRSSGRAGLDFLMSAAIANWLFSD